MNKFPDNCYSTLGWGEIKKCSPIDSGILWGHADIYRSLLVEKNRGPFFIKFWAQQP